MISELVKEFKYSNKTLGTILYYKDDKSLMKADNFFRVKYFFLAGLHDSGCLRVDFDDLQSAEEEFEKILQSYYLLVSKMINKNPPIISIYQSNIMGEKEISIAELYNSKLHMWYIIKYNGYEILNILNMPESQKKEKFKVACLFTNDTWAQKENFYLARPANTIGECYDNSMNNFYTYTSNFLALQLIKF